VGQARSLPAAFGFGRNGKLSGLAPLAPRAAAWIAARHCWNSRVRVTCTWRASIETAFLRLSALSSMQLLRRISVCLLLLGSGCSPQVSIPRGVQVFFSPRGGATEAVCDALGRATNTVLVQAYSFTSAPIAEALVAAHRRGLEIHVILDRSQRTERYSEADFLKNSGLPPLIDAEHAIAHNKIMIIDDYLVITGSFNFTKAAEEENAENLLVINDPVLAKQFVRNWQAHAEHSEAYDREARPAPKTARSKRG
jgi:phosphatidylserine/phosphatidylglycerophosphate/cardiolipin synthase-like enzyme